MHQTSKRGRAMLVSETNPAEQGLKLVARSKTFSISTGLRDESSRTRIETKHPQPGCLAPWLSLRDESSRTRIETPISPNRRDGHGTSLRDESSRTRIETSSRDPSRDPAPGLRDESSRTRIETLDDPGFGCRDHGVSETNPAEQGLKPESSPYTLSIAPGSQRRIQQNKD